MSQLRDTPLSGLEAKEHGVISSAAAQGRTASTVLFFPAWVWPLAKSALGWGLLGFRKTAFRGTVGRE